MKLYWSSRSPYVRKVMLAAYELELQDKLELIPVVVSPYAAAETLAPHNPLIRIPTLLTDSGDALIDSSVICYYLDTVAGPRLFPAEGEQRWRALNFQAMGTGLLDTLVYWLSVRTRFEGPLVEALASTTRTKLKATLDYFESEAHRFPIESPDIGSLSIGSALGYLDFRFAAEAWRNGRPVLAEWYEELARRPSFVATAPADK